MSEDAMTVYEGPTAPLRRWIMRQRVKIAVARTITNQAAASIKYDVGCAWDELYGRTGGVLPSQTTNAIPHFVISNEGLRALRHTGYDLCYTCDGDGWDADWGGPHICPECGGKGIVKVSKELCECGHPKSYHYRSRYTCHGGLDFSKDDCWCHGFKNEHENLREYSGPLELWCNQGWIKDEKSDKMIRLAEYNRLYRSERSR